MRVYRAEIAAKPCLARKDESALQASMALSPFGHRIRFPSQKLATIGARDLSSLHHPSEPQGAREEREPIGPASRKGMNNPLRSLLCAIVSLPILAGLASGDARGATP